MRVVAAHVVSGDKNDILLLDSVSLDDTPFELPPEREVTPEAYLPSFVSYHVLHDICVANILTHMFVIVAQLEASAEAGCASIESTNKTRHTIYIYTYRSFDVILSVLYTSILPIRKKYELALLSMNDALCCKSNLSYIY